MIGSLNINYSRLTLAHMIELINFNFQINSVFKMSENCLKCSKLSYINHPCENHATCMKKSGKGHKGGLKWHPETCDTCNRLLAGVREKDEHSITALKRVLKQARHHRLRSGIKKDEINNLFEDDNMKEELLHLLTTPQSDVSGPPSPKRVGTYSNRSMSLSKQQAISGESST